jgi:hypothetical protein
VTPIDLVTARIRVNATSAAARQAMVAVGVAGAWNVAELLLPRFATVATFAPTYPVGLIATPFVGFAVHLVAIVLYCRWLYRAHEDCYGLGGREVVRPGAAIQAFFIPVYNLYMPFRILRDLHAASDPRMLPDPPQYEAATGTQYRSSGMKRIPSPDYERWFPVRAWWASYMVLPLLFGVVTSALTWTSIGSYGLSAGYLGLFVGLVTGALQASAAVLAICVVRGIVSRQNERLRRLEAAQAADVGSVANVVSESPLRAPEAAAPVDPGPRVAAQEPTLQEEEAPDAAGVEGRRGQGGLPT